MTLGTSRTGRTGVRLASTSTLRPIAHARATPAPTAMHASNTDRNRGTEMLKRQTIEKYPAARISSCAAAFLRANASRPGPAR